MSVSMHGHVHVHVRICVHIHANIHASIRVPIQRFLYHLLEPVRIQNPSYMLLNYELRHYAELSENKNKILVHYDKFNNWVATCGLVDCAYVMGE